MVTFDNVFAYSLAGGAAVDPGTSTGGALTTNLISYWKLDESAGNDRVDSHGSNDMTENGTCQGNAGIINGSFSPNGSSTYLSRTTSPVDGNKSFSFSLWVDSGPTSYAPIIACNVFYYRSYNRTPRFTLYGSGGNVVATDTVQTTDNVFYHIVCVHDFANSEILLYVNNAAPIITSYTFAPFAPSGEFRFGRGINSEFGGNSVNLDEVAFWDDRVLTAADVTTLYNAGAGLEYENF